MPADSDAVLRAVGLVVTLTALVLGFFVNSAKAYYDAVSNDLKEIGADVSMLDRSLQRFGPEATPARTLLRQSTGAAVRALPAEDDQRRHLKEQALSYTAAMEHESLLLGEITATCTGAILMILEFSSPLHGIVRISPAVLEAPLTRGETAPTSAMP